MTNILLMIMDDQAPGTLSALGHPSLRTPNLDRLMRGGTYVEPYTTCPVCTPARAEVLTGVTGLRNGCRWFGEPIDPHYTLLPRWLHEAGYHTVHVGKWHNDGHPRDKGYDVTRRVFPSDLVDGYRTKHDFGFDEGGKIVQGHSTEVFCDAAIEELPRRPSDRPWFMFLALHSPHDPREVPEHWPRRHTPQSTPLPPNYMPEHPFDNGEMTIRDELLEAFPRTQDAIRRHRADYYNMIEHHDHYLGRVLDAVEQMGGFDDTLIIFTSDHGLAVGSHGLMGKESLYEHSARVPTIFHGPRLGVRPQQHRDALCGHADLMPTLADLIGIKSPPTCEGRSYASALRDPTAAARPHAFGNYRDRMFMARDGRYKLITYTTGRRQLFDLRDDPHELQNLLDPWRDYDRDSSCMVQAQQSRYEQIAAHLQTHIDTSLSYHKVRQS